MSQTQTLPIAEIQPNPFQPRLFYDPAQMEELKESIKELGLQQPITVRRQDDRWYLIDGSRRLKCVEDLGWTEVEAAVVETDDLNAGVLSFVSNMKRAGQSEIEIAVWVGKMVSEHMARHEGWDERRVVDLLAPRVGIKADKLKDYLKASRLPMEKYQDAHDNKFGLTRLVSMVTPAKAKVVPRPVEESETAEGTKAQDRERQAEPKADPADADDHLSSGGDRSAQDEVLFESLANLEAAVDSLSDVWSGAEGSFTPRFFAVVSDQRNFLNRAEKVRAEVSGIADRIASSLKGLKQ